MFRFWSKSFIQYSTDNDDYWRVRLIHITLLFSSLYFLILSLINLFQFNDILYFLLDAIGFILSICIYVYYRYSGKVSPTAWSITLLVTAIILSYIVAAKGYSHSLYWATIIPPIAFFLIGRNWGSLISLIVFAVCSIVVYQQIQQQQPVTFGIGSLQNIINVSIAHILLFRFYEGTRSLAYKQLAAKNQKIQQMAEIDKLTGLYNREKLDSKLTEILSDFLTHQIKVTVIILDVDHFKAINDNHGHLMGDKVLAAIAERLRSKMRQGDILARWGGEEFVVVLSNTELQAGLTQAERLRDDISSHTIEGLALTISLGVAQNEQGDSGETLLDRADQALYRAKNLGRNRVEAQYL